MIKEILLASALFLNGGQVVIFEDEETPVQEPQPTDPETPTDPSLTDEEENGVGDELGVTEEEQESAKEEIIGKLKDFAGEYINKQTLQAIIQYAIDTGILSALAFVLVKYRKYKSKSSEEISKDVLNMVEKEAHKAIAELNKEQLESLNVKIEDVEKSLNTLTKVLILAQDKTAEGKKAVLDALIEASRSEEVKEIAESKKEEIAVEVKQEEEIKEAIKEDYNPID